MTCRVVQEQVRKRLTLVVGILGNNTRVNREEMQSERKNNVGALATQILQNELRQLAQWCQLVVDVQKVGRAIVIRSVVICKATR